MIILWSIFHIEDMQETILNHDPDMNFTILMVR